MPLIQDQLKSLRLGAGLTQAALALRMKSSTKRVTNIEKGIRAPSLELIGEWAAACGHEMRLDFPRTGSLVPVPASALDEVLALVEGARGVRPEAVTALRQHVDAWRALARPARE